MNLIWNARSRIVSLGAGGVNVGDIIAEVMLLLPLVCVDSAEVRPGVDFQLSIGCGSLPRVEMLPIVEAGEGKSDGIFEFQVCDRVVGYGPGFTLARDDKSDRRDLRLGVGEIIVFRSF